MSFISIASTFAIVLGFAGTIPHIRTMLKSRSSGGQSPLGWSMGISVNVLTGYVNLAGPGAIMLGVGNVLAGTFSVIALTCVVRFRHGAAEHAAVAVAAVVPEQARALFAFHELPTGEFDALKSLIDEEHARRETFQAADAHAEPAESFAPFGSYERERELEPVPA